MKIVRIISDGWHTHLEIDGQMYGSDIRTVKFTHDTSGNSFDGYKRPVLQIECDDGTVFDSRFEDDITAKPQDMNDVFDLSFEGISKTLADAIQDKDNAELMCWNEAENNRRDAELEQEIKKHRKEIQEMRQLLNGRK